MARDILFWSRWAHQQQPEELGPATPGFGDDGHDDVDFPANLCDQFKFQSAEALMPAPPMLVQAMALPENLACLLLSFILRHMRPLNIGSRATEQQLPFDRNTSEASGRTANPLAAAPAAATRLWLNAAAAETATAAATDPAHAKYSQEGHLSWEFICYARGYFLCPRPLLAIVLQRFSATEHHFLPPAPLRASPLVWQMPGTRRSRKLVPRSTLSFRAPSRGETSDKNLTCIEIRHGNERRNERRKERKRQLTQEAKKERKERTNERSEI